MGTARDYVYVAAAFNSKYRNIFAQAGKTHVGKVLTGFWPNKNWSFSLVGYTSAGRVTLDLVDEIQFLTADLVSPNEEFCEPNSTLGVLALLGSPRCPPPPQKKKKKKKKKRKKEKEIK